MPYYYHEVNHSKTPHAVYVRQYTNTNGNEVIGGIWSKEQELLLVEKGTLELFIDSKNIIVHEGEIACVNSGRMHYGNSVGEEQCVVASFLIDLNHMLTPGRETDSEHMIGLCEGILNFPSLIKKDFHYYKEILQDFKEIKSVYETKSTSYELRMKSLLMDIFYYLDQEPHFYIHDQEWERAKTKERRDRIFSIFDFLEKNYMNQITIEDMANHIYVGKDAFYKFFKSMTGESPVDYLIDIRLSKAKEILLRTDEPILDICFKTGFLNESYFIRQFKKRCGTTPKQFRMKTRIQAN